MPEFRDIIKRIDKAINRFNKLIPRMEREMFNDIQEQVKRLDTSNGKVKTTVANLRIIASIKAKLLKLILTPEYIKEVKEFAKAFNDVTRIQNEYWKQVETAFKPKTFLKEIRNQAISDTVAKLTESGIGSTIQEQVTNILRTNITTGGSYAALTDQLRESILTTDTDGLLQRYAKQITTDSLNQYSAQYTQAVSNDLGFEWYSWQGSEIMTSRPFCQAMVENNRYFHISQVPNLLKGLDAQGNKLEYIDNKTEEEKKVEIYSRTGLPHGFIPGTNAANFFVNRGGYMCAHIPRPVSERLVPIDVKEKVFATQAYKQWKG
jgi:hypothetical protein